MKRFLRVSWLACIVFAGCLVAGRPAVGAESSPKPLVAPLFSDNVVLQRGVADPIWGWTEPGRKVTVSVAGESATDTADDRGRWRVKIGPLPMGGPYTLTIQGARTVTLDNVLVGDVWLVSGQSNVELGVGLAKNAQQEIANADHPRLRLFSVPRTAALGPRDTLDEHSDHPMWGKWQVSSPQTVANNGRWEGFSAVAYFMGRDLQNRLGVPIGIINASWGGTPAEAWTPASQLADIEAFEPTVKGLRWLADRLEKAQGDRNRVRKHWYVRYDAGTSGGWEKPGFDDSAWPTTDQPRQWASMGLTDFDGVVWFRRQVDLPQDWAAQKAVLHLGPIDDADTAWVNGTQVGGTNGWGKPRAYDVPAGLLKAGRNVIVVRILDSGGEGGLGGKGDQMKLESGDQTASLAGPWRYHRGVSLEDASVPPSFRYSPHTPTTLYNGMIAPLGPLAIKGVAWYQGATNVVRILERSDGGRTAAMAWYQGATNADGPGQYIKVLSALIRGWREQFNQPELPFLIVQLANYHEPRVFQEGAEWRALSDAQRYVAQHMPHAALVCIVDLGEADDIHPRNKQDVGHRLMLGALDLAYGADVVSSGPTYAGMDAEGAAVRIRFDHLGGGLKVKGDGKLRGFVLAGADHHFVPAEARIDGDTVIVTSPGVDRPAAVRYGWANNPIANLYNQADLPTVPFRTDSPWDQ